MRTVIKYLEESTKTHPNCIACADEYDELTFVQLWLYSEAIVNFFYKKENTSSPVAIVSTKSVWILVVIWAVIKSGRPYTVIDPMIPKERLYNILSVLDTDTIVAEEKYKKKIARDESIVELEILKEDMLKSGDEVVYDRVQNDITPLYIMFTSGSTGIPKGVIVNHRSVVDFIDEFTETFGINENDVIGNQAPWDFDVSVKDIFSSAKVGAKLQIIPRKLFSFPKQLVNYIDEKKITTMIWSVSALRIISSTDSFDYCVPKSISKLIFSGEVMPAKHYNEWRRRYPNALFANVYGPTEITCNCTYYVQEGLIGDKDVIPIGEAFRNEKVFLLDEHDQIVSKSDIGRTGEICVSGTAVSMGYYGNKKATDESFVQNPVNTKYNEIIYRTGDLGYYNENLLLVYAGRIDNQIKHQGHRIELEEVERALYSLPEIRECCCIYKDEMIVAYIVGDINEKQISLKLQKIVPNYMIPTKYIFMDVLPLNNHGKVDRKLLNQY